MARRTAAPTQQELELTKVVSGARPHDRARRVRNASCAQRQIAYTTVMTMMRILERKGHLKVQPRRPCIC